MTKTKEAISIGLDGITAKFRQLQEDPEAFTMRDCLSMTQILHRFVNMKEAFQESDWIDLSEKQKDALSLCEDILLAKLRDWAEHPEINESVESTTMALHRIVYLMRREPIPIQ